jgi:hypothetical protein
LGRFASTNWGSLGLVRGGFFLVECEQFALRSRQTALGRNSVPESAFPGKQLPCECPLKEMIYGGF